jgi:hypothetical protein
VRERERWYICYGNFVAFIMGHLLHLLVNIGWFYHRNLMHLGVVIIEGSKKSMNMMGIMAPISSI